MASSQKIVDTEVTFHPRHGGNKNGEESPDIIDEEFSDASDVLPAESETGEKEVGDAPPRVSPNATIQRIENLTGGNTNVTSVLGTQKVMLRQGAVKRPSLHRGDYLSRLISRVEAGLS